MTDWVRLWHDMPTDPKWRTIARKSGQRVGDVIAVFNFIMVNASGNALERGTMVNFVIEDVASALDIDEADVQSIIDAMQGRVIDGDRLTGWEKRQPKREDFSAAQRKAKWKEKQKNALERTGTQGNAPETETETDIPLSNDNGAIENSDVQFWKDAKSYLATESKNPGALVGKWAGQFGKAATAEAITRAQLERPVQKIPFIQGCLKQKARDPTALEFGPC